MQIFFKNNHFAINLIIISFFIFVFNITNVYAVYVSGYYRSNGTYVNGYERTSPDGDPYNNYSYPGNYNPNTGSITTGNPDTYLNNYYNNSSYTGYSSGYDSYYSYPTTPTCPSNSYYDGISSCKCNYGYIVSGSSCVNANLYCSNKIGLMSQYNSISKTCECMSGYEFNGSSCVYKTIDYSNTSGYSTNQNICPLNSHHSVSDSTKCYCDNGFKHNLTNDGCILIPQTNNQIANYTSTDNTDSSCKTNYGSGSELQGKLCYCSKNFKWNSTISFCVVGNPVFNKNLSIGSMGADVVNLKNFLAIQGWYTGYVNTVFDDNTKKSVMAFQTINHILSTGTIGPKTRAVINKLINQ